MRLERLDLVRYGALTDRVLDLRAGARLHVVYGPNEAGKSSALNAISDLLFGFPAAAEQNFLHDAASLRIGATLSARNGAKLAFRRRRGRKNTLLAVDEKETPLAEDALVPFLGNLSRDVFERAFGLDSQRLRQGASAMLRSGGEIGSLLFSAASGLAGLSRLRQSLESEADGIYAARRSKDRSFYQALDRHDEARKAERDNELKSGDWKKLIAEAGELETELERLQEQRRETRLALDRLQRLKMLQPLLAEIDGEAVSLAALADLASLPDEYAGVLDQCLKNRSAAERDLHQAERRVLDLGEELSLIQVDGQLLDESDHITRLFADTGNYRSQRHDLPRVEAELAGYDTVLGQLARRLGLADATQLAARQPSDADCVRLAELVDEGRRQQREEQGISQQLEDERRLLTSLEKDSPSGRLVDPRPYLDQLEALAGDLSIVVRHDALETQIRRADVALREAAARLRPPVTDVDMVCTAPLPDGAEIQAQRATIDGARASLRDATEALRAHDEQLMDIERVLADVAERGPVVTREEIEGARRARDSQWRSIRDGWTGKKQPVDEDVVTAFATSLVEADRLADAALSDADRVARYADNRLRRARLLQERDAVGKRQAECQEKLDQVTAHFAALFAVSGIKPLDAAAMLEWRRGVDGLLREREALHDLQDQRSHVTFAEERLSPALKNIAETIGFEGGQLPPAAMAEGLRKHLRLLSERWSETRKREGEIASARDRIARLTEQLRDVAERQAGWHGSFGKNTSSFGLPADTTLEMAAAALKAWAELPDVLVERDNRQRRVSGMRRDMADFERRLSGLAAAAGDLTGHLPSDVVADTLHERLSAARGEQKKRDRLDEELRRVESQVSHCSQTLAAELSRIDELTSGLPEDVDLTVLLSRLRERERLDARLAERRERFRQQADGAGEDEVRAALESFERVAAELEIERLTAEDARQFTTHGELMARLSENQRQRRALETGTSAEYAVFEKLAAEDEAKELARQWVVLKLAAHMLASSVESYREQRADPVILRAGELFSLLTGGRFSRLVEEHDDKDALQLLAERKGGERVPLGGLSEGTGDQLYLALRLAFLEDYSARNEPSPLIVDDIFQTFDDERAASGLKALAGTGDRFQTILFTHQMSIVDIAKQEIGKDLDLVLL